MGCLKLSYDQEEGLNEQGPNIFWTVGKNTADDQKKRIDYYAGGLVMREAKDEPYRFGYQGQFSERDSTTGWNHFELRQYDPVTSRWNSTDPAGQFASPYVAMGNNPISGIDPDGAWVKGAGFWNNVFHSDNMIYANMHADGVNARGIYDALATKIDGEAYLFMSDKHNSYENGTYSSKHVSQTIVNKDGSLGATFGDFVYTSNLASGRADFDPLSQFLFAPGAGQVVGIPVAVGLRAVGRISVPVYRVFGGGISRASGEYWSLINPRLYGSSYRSFAGLPNWNAAAFQVRGSVTLGDMVRFGRIRSAAPFHGNFGRLVPEIRINPSRVNLTHYNGFKLN